MKATTATAPWYSRGRSLTTLSLTLMFSVCFATSRSSQSVCAEGRSRLRNKDAGIGALTTLPIMTADADTSWNCARWTLLCCAPA